MFKANKVIGKVMFIGADIVSSVCAVYTALWIRFYSGLFSEIQGIVYAGQYRNSLIIIVPIIIFINFISAVYKSNIELKFFKEIKKLFLSHTISIFILMGLTFMTREGMNFSRLAIAFFYGLNLMLDIVFRYALRWALKYNCVKGKKYSIVILGTGKLAKMYYDNMKKYSFWGYDVIGFLTPQAGVVRNIDRKMLLGTFEDFLAVYEKYKFNEVVVALHIKETSYIDKIMELCDLEGIRVKIVPGYYEYLQYKTTIDDLDGLPVLTVRGVPLDMLSKRVLKRTFDICFSLFVLVVTFPLLFIIGIAVKITSSPGPIFFKQERVGLNNKPFVIFKFRTMRLQKPEDEVLEWSVENDPRVTKLGSFLRRTNLDEMPQFYNALKGDMSVVGPRPERPYWVSKFKEEIPTYMLRHYVKSGITGWAQVNGYRGDTSIEERIKYDNYYIRNWNIFFDIKIILMTLLNRQRKSDVS